jgi:hypothetical protein
MSDYDGLPDKQASVLTDAEWKLAMEYWGEEFSDPATRIQFDAMMRADPEQLANLRRTLASVQAQRSSSLSPQAKQWLIRAGVATVIGLIALANQHK